MNRRGFLQTSVVALPVAAFAPAVAPAATCAESPQMLRLAAALDVADGAFRQADRRRIAALRAYKLIEPVVPDALVVTRTDFNFYSGEAERDFDHCLVYRGADGGVRNVLTAAGCLRDVDDYGLRSARGREAMRLYKIAKAFEAARDLAQDRADLTQADMERTRAVMALERVATEIGDATMQTVFGLKLKARAMLAVSQISEEKRIMAAYRWGAALAEAVSASA